jgi:feruloyl esterase
MAVFAKLLVGGVYGEPPAYSSFGGCSQGWAAGAARAGAAEPGGAFDGIEAAAAPVFASAESLPTMMLPHVVMRERGVFPRRCEVDYITRSAVVACDALNDVEDGLVA